MLDLKPYGAFIENTVRPLLLEIERVCDKHNFDASKWTKLVWIVGSFHLVQTLIKSIAETISIIAVVWLISENFK